MIDDEVGEPPVLELLGGGVKKGGVFVEPDGKLTPRSFDQPPHTALPMPCFSRIRSRKFPHLFEIILSSDSTNILGYGEKTHGAGFIVSIEGRKIFVRSWMSTALVPPVGSAKGHRLPSNMYRGRLS